MTAPADVARPTFCLISGAGRVLAVELDGAQLAPVHTVGELQAHGFEIDGREPETEYRVQIGDLDPPDGKGLGRAFGSRILWEEFCYFESARGRVEVSLFSRPAGVAEWRLRARLEVNVLPTKLGEYRYRRMLEDLRGLAAGLVFDLVSKAKGAVDVGPREAGHAGTMGSSQLELRVLERRWPEIARVLLQIAKEPASALHMKRDRQQVWGSERLQARALSDLVRLGVRLDRGTGLPVTIVNQCARESNNTSEHATIAWWLRLLEARVAECGSDAQAQIVVLERERPFRDLRLGDQLSLYETEDRPRIERLEQAVGRAERLRTGIRRARDVEFLRGVRPHYSPAQTPIFEHVYAYRRLRHEVRSYLDASSVVIADTFEERVKATSRLYEQWLFFQIAAALRAAGLRPQTQGGLLHAVGARRFTVDLERDSRMTFAAGDGRTVVLRYEPVILTEERAKARRDSLYRGGSRSAPAWSPDVVIEFHRSSPESASEASLEDVVVVDAKYSSSIGERHWEGTMKYFEIRACRDGRQVVRHLWLGHPGKEDSIACFDDSVRWTPWGPECPRTELLRGILALRPVDGANLGAGDEVRDGWVTPNELAVEFVRGLLAYFGCSPASALERRSRPETDGAAMSA